MRQSIAIKIVLAVLVLAAAGTWAVFFYFRPDVHRQTLKSPTHYSYFSQAEFYEQAYQSAGKQATGLRYAPDAKAIIVNHHLLAGNFIAETFNAVATTAPLTVLLISPNHFDAGKADVITSEADWQTPYGVLPADTLAIKKITDEHLASVEESPFDQEHGISGIVAFIKKSLPNAKVVPLIFRNRMTLGQDLSLADKYYGDIGKNILVVGSFDFSHYLTSRAADFHDIENLATVQNGDTLAIYNLDIDSRPGLAFYLRLLKDIGAQDFHLLEHSNSAKLTGQDALETTSYIDGYFTNGPAGTSSANTLLVLPSIASSAKVADSLNRYSKSWSVEYLERLFYGQDKSLVFIDGDKNLASSALGRYGVTDLASADKQVTIGSQLVQIFSSPNPTKAEQAISLGAAAVIQYHGASDNISFYKNSPVITIKNPLLSDTVLKTGGASIAYGLAWQGNELLIYLFPIGVGHGQLKLLVGAESGTVLAEMAKNSSVDESLKSQIRNGIINNNFK